MVKCDYATLTILPGNSGFELEETLDRALDALLLTDMFEQFEVVASNINYAAILRFADIQIKLSSVQNFGKTGICFEFSGQGLNYYATRLHINHMLSLRTAFNRFRCLCVEGFKTKCSRFDIAADDKVHGAGPGLLDLNRIEKALKDRAFVTKFRSSQPNFDSAVIEPYYIIDPSAADTQIPVNFIQSMNLSTGVIGKTIYLGSRQSNSFVRIYDKLAEQQKNGKDTGDLSHWVRFELELKHANAASIFSAFCEARSDVEFSEFCSRVFLDLIRFVDLDKSRRYESTVSAWWLAFLRDIGKKGLFLNKVERNQYVRSLKHYNEVMAASFVALVASGGVKFLNTLVANGVDKNSKTKQRILSDYRALISLSEEDREAAVALASGEESGIDFWDRYSWAIDFKHKINSLHELYFNIAV